MCGGQRGQKKLYIRFCFGFRNLIKFTGKVLRVGSMDHDLLFFHINGFQHTYYYVISMFYCYTIILKMVFKCTPFTSLLRLLNRDIHIQKQII